MAEYTCAVKFHCFKNGHLHCFIRFAGWGADEASARQTNKTHSPERETSKSGPAGLFPPFPARSSSFCVSRRSQSLCVGAKWAAFLPCCVTVSPHAEALCCQSCAVQNILASILSRSTCFWRVTVEANQAAAGLTGCLSDQHKFRSVVESFIRSYCCVFESSVCFNTPFITLYLVCWYYFSRVT